MKAAFCLIVGLVFPVVSIAASDCDDLSNKALTSAPAELPPILSVADVEMARTSLNGQLNRIQTRIGDRLSMVAVRPDSTLAVNESGGSLGLRARDISAFGW